MNRYAQRDAVLREMGFNSYKEYLASPLWKSIRVRLLRVCKTCVCGKEATEFHHRTYKRRYLEGRGKIHKFITPICRECHEQIEFDGSQKLSLGWANSKLLAIQEDAEKRGVKLPNKARMSVRHQRKRHDKWVSSNIQRAAETPLGVVRT